MQVYHLRSFALGNLNGEAQLHYGRLGMVSRRSCFIRSHLFVSAKELIDFAQTCCAPGCPCRMLDADFLSEMNYAWECEPQTEWGIPGEKGCCVVFCQ